VFGLGKTPDQNIAIIEVIYTKTRQTIAKQREITNHWSGQDCDILVASERYLCRSIQPLYVVRVVK
jgi:hypothetical protein